ncbi:MAG: hypothetical protein ACHQ1D_12890, partial [Nitrososphaerales archaeon]
IYRVPECEPREERIKDDKTFCLTLCKDVLGVDILDEDIAKLFRLGKRGEQCRPILVQFRERSIKNRIMESLYKLKNAEDHFKNISVVHDMTKQERAACKALVQEAKTRQSSEQGECKWRVRGLPGMLKIVKVRN